MIQSGPHIFEEVLREHWFYSERLQRSTRETTPPLAGMGPQGLAPARELLTAPGSV